MFQLQTVEEEDRKKFADLQNQVSTLQQQHQVLLWETEEKLKCSQQKALEAKEVFHKEEITALTTEWNRERKVSLSVLHCY